MATLIREQLRNPVDNTWIPLREVEGDAQGKVTAIKQLQVGGTVVNFPSPNGSLYPVGYSNGEIVPIDTTYIYQEGEVQTTHSPLTLKNGQLETEDPLIALENLELDVKNNSINTVFTWDGMDNGEEGVTFCKVAEETFSFENFVGGTLEKTLSNGTVETYDIVSSHIYKYDDKNFIVLLEDADGLGLGNNIALDSLILATKGVAAIYNNSSSDELDGPGLYFFRSTMANALYYISKLTLRTKRSVVNISSGGTGSTSKAGAANSLAVESLIGGTAIAENDDLNDYNTVGNYYSSGATRTATLSNIPDGLADGFQLKVKYVYGNYISGTNYLTQELISNNGRHYSRGKAPSGGWGAWAKTYTTREIVAVEDGGTGASTAKGALNNLGITWGTTAAPNKGTPNTIYIQLLSAEG